MGAADCLCQISHAKHVSSSEGGHQHPLLYGNHGLQQPAVEDVIAPNVLRVPLACAGLEQAINMSRSELDSSQQEVMYQQALQEALQLHISALMGGLVLSPDHAAPHQQQQQHLSPTVDSHTTDATCVRRPCVSGQRGRQFNFVLASRFATALRIRMESK